MQPQSLRTRLVLSHLLVSLTSIALLLVFASRFIINYSRQELEHSLEDFAFAVSNSVENSVQAYYQGEQSVEQVEAALAPLFVGRGEIRYTIYLVNGEPLLDSSRVLPARADVDTTPEVWQALWTERGEGERTEIENGTEIFNQAVRIERENEVLGVLRLSIPMTESTMEVRRTLASLLLISLGIGAAVMIIGYLLAGTAVRPIAKIMEASERVAQGDLDTRVEPAGPEETHRLAESFNIMAGRIQSSVDQMRAFVANASHELRTPLTVVKLRVEALQNGALEDMKTAQRFLADIEFEIDRLGSMVNDLLDLSRMDGGLSEGECKPLQMDALATEVYEVFSIRSARAGLNLELDCQPDLPAVFGNEEQLRRLLYNFMDNAIKYTPRGGSIRLGLRSGLGGRTVRVLVQDTGVGIPEKDLPYIFDRFYRVERTRPVYGDRGGTGLGLAIAKSIVDNHGGKVGVSSRRGEGAIFWAELPTQPRTPVGE